jgi:hypothetical protein
MSGTPASPAKKVAARGARLPGIHAPSSPLVMPGLDPGIHAFLLARLIRLFCVFRMIYMAPL